MIKLGSLCKNNIYIILFNQIGLITIIIICSFQDDETEVRKTAVFSKGWPDSKCGGANVWNQVWISFYFLYISFCLSLNFSVITLVLSLTALKRSVLQALPVIIFSSAVWKCSIGPFSAFHWILFGNCTFVP